MENITMEKFDKFFEAILKLKNKEDCYKFFEDVCTIKELQEITQRVEVATLLNGGMNYQEISKNTGASTATISRVNRCLLYGKGGYNLVLKESEKDGKEQ